MFQPTTAPPTSLRASALCPVMLGCPSCWLLWFDTWGEGRAWMSHEVHVCPQPHWDTRAWKINPACPTEHDLKHQPLKQLHLMPRYPQDCLAACASQKVKVRNLLVNIIVLQKGTERIGKSVPRDTIRFCPVPQPMRNGAGSVLASSCSLCSLCTAWPVRSALRLCDARAFCSRDGQSAFSLHPWKGVSGWGSSRRREGRQGQSSVPEGTAPRWGRYRRPRARTGAAAGSALPDHPRVRNIQPGAEQCRRRPAVCLARAAAHLAPFLSESHTGFVATSGFVARLLFWMQRCSCVPWPFCPSAKGPAVKEDCPDHPPQAAFPQPCLPQSFLIAGTNQR